MCFFKPKMPTAIQPKLPTIQETAAPEPQAPIFGGGADSIAKDSQPKRGVQGLKIAQVEKPVSLSPVTGTASGGLNVLR